jgi:subtilisin family serine protease
MKKSSPCGLTFAASLLLVPTLFASQGGGVTIDGPTGQTGAQAESIGSTGRPTQDLGWLVSVRPQVGHAARLQKLGELRGRLATSTNPTDRRVLRVEFETAAEELVESGRITSLDARTDARARGLVVGETLWLSPGFAIAPSDGKLLDSLRSHPDVLAIQKVTWQMPQIGTAMNALHHDGAAVHAMSLGGINLKGAGVEIAVLDSGMDLNTGSTGRPHKAFFANGNPVDLSGGGIGGSRVLTSNTFGTPYYFGPQVAEDLHGHGTRVASTIGAAKWSFGQDVADSFSSEAHLHNFKISDDAFAGAPASIFVMSAALEAAALDPSIRIANMSYDGTANPNWYPNMAIDAASNAGVFVTLSAGNAGSDLTFAHGAYNGMVVGGSYEFTPSPYFTSAIGPLASATTGDRRYPDMIAVGDQVTTAQLDNEAKYTIATGTSMSAGFVAGSAALLLQADPGLSPVEVKATLLNNTWSVLAGDQNAVGLGYLRTKESVEAVLAGDVRDGMIEPDSSSAHLVTLSAGQVARYTLVWERIHSGPLSGPDVPDFDLRVFDPSGSLVAFSATLFDVEETVGFTAPVTGTYRIVIANDESSPSGPAIHYGLAGTGLGACSTVQVNSIAPASSPAVTTPALPNLVWLTGCGLDTVTQVRIGGAQVAFGITNPESLTLAIPLLPVYGLTDVELVHPGGASVISLHLDAVDPLLGGLSVAPYYLATDVIYGSKPGDLHILAFSLAQQASTLPGVVAMDIGAGFTDLTIAMQSVIPAGQGYGVFTIPAFVASLATQYYLQSVVIDGAAPTFPLPVSNVHTVEFFP